MRPPRIPPLARDIIQTALCAFDGAEFNRIAGCPSCGGPVTGYDTRQKRFAVLKEQGKERVVSVRVKRFICKKCKTLCNADEPFYPDTRIGSPVIDLFFTLCTTLPKSRAARMIEAMGIIVDRTTWRNYHRECFPEIPAVDVFGTRFPNSVLSLSNLAAQVTEGGCIAGAEALAACGFPSAYRAAPDLPFFGKEGQQGNNKEQKEKRQSCHPQENGQGK